MLLKIILYDIQEEGDIALWKRGCYFPFQPVLHDWYDKGCGMSYAVCGIAAKQKE